MPSTPLADDDLERLQTALDALPSPLEPLDATMLDGYLCGVLLQPRPVPLAQWLPPALDTQERPLPAGVPAAELRQLIERRHAELDQAIGQRQWFDPWIFEPDDEALSPTEVVGPWVAGFAHACAHFPALMNLANPGLLEPLALLYLHLDPDELEDADELLAEIETLEPPQDLPEAVESLVRATLLLADVSRPQRVKAPARRAAPPPNQVRPGSRPPAKRGAPRRR
jgi:uncharacterized protein